jgi:hypothetical protein
MENRKILPWFIMVAFVNTFLWLDSLDQYVSTRFHIRLTETVPDSFMSPSIRIKELLALGNKSNSNEKLVNLEKSQESSKISEPKGQASTISTGNKINDPVSGLTNLPQQKIQVTNLSNVDNLYNNSVANQELAKSSFAELPLKTGSFKMMFAGDSMMQGVAPLVISSLRKIYPKSIYDDLSKQSTGLTVKRYFDWPTKIKEGIAKDHYKVIIVFLGPNDPWDIYENKKVYKFPSTEWEEIYRLRVEEVLQFAKHHEAQIIWIGLPNMGEDRVRQGAIIQNRVFKNEAEKYNFQYISTEEMIGRLDEPYKAYIKDPNKGDVLLRASDGIHFSPTALRMISSSVVNAVTRLDIE